MKLLIILIAPVFLGLIGIIGFMLYDAKVDNAFKNHKIIKAIHEHNMACIHTFTYPLYRISYDEMEDLDQTINRFWDWGYTRILPKDRYELIKNLIQ